MITRRSNANKGLPLTNNDLNARSSNMNPGSTNGARIRRKPAPELPIPHLGIALCLTLMLGCLYLAIHFFPDQLSKPIEKSLEVEHRNLPLSKFTSLEYALQNSQLVGLYFAASWCPMSTPVTEKIDSILGDDLLPPPTPANPKPASRSRMSLVYISSDRNEADFEKYQRRNWISVPWESTDRTKLKKHFSVCAKPEEKELKMKRRYEIPTLLILDGVSHSIITFNGAEDVEEYGEDVLDHWDGLRDIVRAMESKYGYEDVRKFKRPQDPQNHHGDLVSSLFA